MCGTHWWDFSWFFFLAQEKFQDFSGGSFCLLDMIPFGWLYSVLKALGLSPEGLKTETVGERQKPG